MDRKRYSYVRFDKEGDVCSLTLNGAGYHCAVCTTPCEYGHGLYCAQCMLRTHPVDLCCGETACVHCEEEWGCGP